MSPLQLHGSCVAFDNGAVLLRGVPASGKSDLAYRLVSEQGARLVADDQVVLDVQSDRLVARAKAGWSGLLELRGLGLVTLPAASFAPLVLLVDLVGREDVPRLPEAAYAELIGHRLPVLRLHAFDATTPAKVKLAVRYIPERGVLLDQKGGFPGDDGQLG